MNEERPPREVGSNLLLDPNAQQTPRETFDSWQVQCAIEQFLQYGEEQFLKSQQGYYSGYGWAARCLRFHLEELKRGAVSALGPNR
jgi:hypothetical protein